MVHSTTNFFRVLSLFAAFAGAVSYDRPWDLDCENLPPHPCEDFELLVPNIWQGNIAVSDVQNICLYGPLQIQCLLEDITLLFRQTACLRHEGSSFSVVETALNPVGGLIRTTNQTCVESAAVTAAHANCFVRNQVFSADCSATDGTANFSLDAALHLRRRPGDLEPDRGICRYIYARIRCMVARAVAVCGESIRRFAEGMLHGEASKRFNMNNRCLDEDEDKKRASADVRYNSLLTVLNGDLWKD